MNNSYNHTINIVGFYNLYLKECRRFVNVYMQTLLAPVITTLLFLAVFVLALGRDIDIGYGLSFTQFLAPGLIAMSMLQNAFANTSSSLISSKLQGSIVDVLLAPLSPIEFVFGYIFAAITRGIVIGAFLYAVLSLFIDMSLHHIGYVVIFSILGCSMVSFLGLIGGIWAQKFDHVALISNFIITPLSFLSGTFYTLDKLPDFFQNLAYANPFFHMIDGMRYSLIGINDVAPLLSMSMLLATNIMLFIISYYMVKSGYKLKS